MEPAFEASVVHAHDFELKLRSYQQEMLDASLSENIIVAMDTGSGKTHIAIARIQAELEQCEPGRIVWFMSPSQALSKQQYEVIKEHLPAYRVISLTGSDGIDKWTDQNNWEKVLTDVSVVVGTPAVLADALTHGFVRMPRISLLVFDEAHRCTKDHPMNKIMKNFYKASKTSGEPIPHILGLSASPVMSKKQSTPSNLENNLDARVKTPKRTRHELEQYVHPPEILTAEFTNSAALNGQHSSALCNRLHQAASHYCFENDPYIRHLKNQDDESSHRQLFKAIQKSKTYCSEQIQVLSRRAQTLQEQLGSIAAEWYARACMDKFEQVASSSLEALEDVQAREQQHVRDIFRDITGETKTTGLTFESSGLTDKARKLLKLLLENASPTFRGIVFVEQRATVSALVHLLQSHPDVSLAFRTGGFVGTSTFASRKSGIADLTEAKAQQKDLDDFRNGRKNLIVATTVLEEGIDISACNHVFCFDLPANLVSFVQRRGRARQRHSKYILFVPQADLHADPFRWQQQEVEMKAAYLDESRESISSAYEDEEALQTRIYCVHSSGALLTSEDAKAHLYHFCATSTQQRSNYVDTRPEFSPTESAGERLWTCTVTLPAFVHADVRTAASAMAWRTEAAAIKDSAFEAYVALHKAGLVNDNLLPLTQDFNPQFDQKRADQPSIVQASQRQDVWKSLAERYDAKSVLYRCTVRLTLGGTVVASMQLVLPTVVRQSLRFPLFWNESKVYECCVEPTCSDFSANEDELKDLQQSTETILRSVHGSRMPAGQWDFIPMLRPEETSDLSAYVGETTGQISAAQAFKEDSTGHDRGLVRVKGQPGRAFIFCRKTSVRTDEGEDQPCLVVTDLPKRREFLHPRFEKQGVKSSYTAERTFTLAECTVDRLPLQHALFAAFVPSILYRIETHVLAERLRESWGNGFAIQDIALVLEAITSPGASERFDYNRLEFLGDAVLKFCAHRQVMAQHTTWPEAYLTQKKSHLVSNTTLWQAAMETMLDSYILSKPFTGTKWRPPYVREKLKATSAGTRDLSSKTIADVVEALIGAAMVDGGLDNAHRCIKTLLPGETWFDEAQIFKALLADLPPCVNNMLDMLEKLTCHRFFNKTLLKEAVTHASVPSQRTGMSYERLEFLGDAVLDLIIVPKLFAHPRKLRHHQMHNIHEALVNGLFLSYCCMQYSIQQDGYSVSDSADGPAIKHSARTLHLHDFLRAGPQVIRAKQVALGAFARLEATIERALRSGQEYPWCDLLALNPPKFLSDIVESVLGALYVDTKGDLTACEDFVERLGILEYMRVMLARDMKTMSPKEQLGVAAGNATVHYAAFAEQCERETERKVWTCKVTVGAEEKAVAAGCGSRAEAEARAALAAVKMLEEDTGANSRISNVGRKRKLDASKIEEHAIADLEDDEVLPGDEEGIDT